MKISENKIYVAIRFLLYSFVFICMLDSCKTENFPDFFLKGKHMYFLVHLLTEV